MRPFFWKLIHGFELRLRPLEKLRQSRSQTQFKSVNQFPKKGSHYMAAALFCLCLVGLLPNSAEAVDYARGAGETETPFLGASPSATPSDSGTPILASISPLSVLPNQTITLMGSGFGNSIASASVFVNSIDCKIRFLVDSTIECLVPWILPRNYSVWVTLRGLTSGILGLEVRGESGFLAIELLGGGQRTCFGAPMLGLLWCFGRNGQGRLGIGSGIDIGASLGEIPFPAVNVGGAFSRLISGSGAHSCVITARRALRCWGAGEFGQLGIGSSRDVGERPGDMPPAEVPLQSQVSDSVVGAAFTCALLYSEELYCWGANDSGQLGIGTSSPLYLPGPATDLSGFSVTAIAAGGAHVCVLSGIAEVACWGDNTFGQLGIGFSNNIGDDAGEMPPSAVAIAGPAAQVACGFYHTCVLLLSNQLYCWGNGGSGQLGNGGDDNQATPGAAIVLDGVPASVALLDVSSCVLYQSGSATCWGDNYFGGLGTGNRLTAFSPPSSTIALGGVPASSISGVLHLCSLLVNGDLTCWGYNVAGQLGIGQRNTVGDEPGEMPPQSALLPLVLLALSSVVYVPLQTLTLVGSRFGDVIGDVTVHFQVERQCSPVFVDNCPVTFVSPLHVECAPVFFDGTPIDAVFISRLGYHESNAVGPLRILPSDPVVISIAPSSGEAGTMLNVSVFGVSAVNETQVQFFLLSNTTSCSVGSGCMGVVLDVDFESQTVLVEVPVLPLSGEYGIVVRTPRGVSRSAAIFTHCDQLCAECVFFEARFKCLRCRSGWHFDSTATSCLPVSSACPVGQVLTEYTPGVQRCACNQTAAPARFLDSSLQMCVTECLETEFLDQSAETFNCRQCDSSCATCSGPGSDLCKLCPVGVKFSGGVNETGFCGDCLPSFVQQIETCVCPPGTYYLPKREQCLPCPENHYSTDYRDPSFESSQSCKVCAASRTTRGFVGQSDESSCLCEPNSYPGANRTHCVDCTSLAGKIRCNGESLQNGNQSALTPDSAGLEVAAGYWLTTDEIYLVHKRSKGSTAEKWFEVVECPVRAACGGGRAESCADGYTGPACGLCAPGHGKLGELCASCPSRGTSQFLVFLALVLVVVICVGVVKSFGSTTEQQLEASGDQGVFMQLLKTAINHLQVLGFIAAFASDWPTILISVFALPVGVATVSSGATTSHWTVPCIHHCLHAPRCCFFCRSFWHQESH
eukprot:TRINITY_DN5302_c0_g1_i2.p1 TRINITY_DN5302_c0_g1~~TRINITY_DN5302_c0_g1_i2.p1  ORF type:complete len:1197 (-),score=194.44 TRINITY_DN5302_c0_g1_i2:914-4504(-)